MRRLMIALVGAHLVLGASLLVIEATHGINDQDASFAVALLFHYVNVPAVWLLRLAKINPTVTAVLAAGVAQWVVLAVVLGGAWRLVSRSALPAGSAERSVSND